MSKTKVSAGVVPSDSCEKGITLWLGDGHLLCVFTLTSLMNVSKFLLSLMNVSKFLLFIRMSVILD